MSLRVPSHEKINPSAPQALGCCDRCGQRWLLAELNFQWDYRGNELQNLHIRVCPPCTDVPAQWIRPIVLGPDPIPVRDPRPDLDGSVQEMGPVPPPFVFDPVDDNAVAAPATAYGFITGEAPTVTVVSIFTAAALNGNFNAYNLRESALTGVADSSTFLLSVWIHNWALNSGDVPIFLIDANTGGSGQVFNCSVLTNSGQKHLSVSLTNDTHVFGFVTQTNADLVAGPWINILMTGNTSFGAGLKVKQVYVNDIAQTFDSVTDAGVAFNVAWTNVIDMAALGFDSLSGDWAELYFAPGQTLDLDVLANRRLFYNGSGEPISLGADGSLPTGTAPAVYFRGPAASAVTNLGTGGAFTLGDQAWTDAGSNP